MIYRIYLAIQTDESSCELFEACNTFPIFWLALLNKEIIKGNEDIWKYYDELVESKNELELDRLTDIIPGPTYFYIEQDQFEINSKRSLDYFNKNYPHLYLLFSEFRDYIGSKLQVGEDNYLMIDAIMLANIKGAIPLLDDLLYLVDSIDNNKPVSEYFLKEDDLVSTATGFGYLSFEQYSSLYKQLLKHTQFEIYTSEPRYPDGTFSRLYTIWYIILLSISMFFTYFLCIGYLKKGVSSPFLMLLFFNIISYWYSIYKIRKQFLLHKKKKYERNSLLKR